MDIDSFTVRLKTELVYADISKDFKTKFGTLNYKAKWLSLPREKSTIMNGLMKDKLSRKIMTKFVGLRPKTFSYLTNDGCYDKKAKTTKKNWNKARN